MVVELKGSQGSQFVCERYVCGQKFDAQDTAIAHEKDVLEHVAVIRDTKTRNLVGGIGGFAMGTLEKDGFKTIGPTFMDEASALGAAEMLRDYMRSNIGKFTNIQTNG